MVAMVNSSYSEGNINNVTINECPGQPLDTNTSTHSEGEFNWSNELQGYILGAFFYGYITTQILGGRLAERYGTKWLFGGSILCTSALSILTPVVARWSPYALIVLRVLEGIGEGVNFPVLYVILAHWCPPLERSRLSTIVASGTHLGTIISMLLSGVISAGIGWEWVFYIFGTVGCLWCVAFLFLVYETPAVHPRITTEERAYIEKAIGPHSVRPPVPWGAVMTSAPFWGIIIAQFTYNWGSYTLLTSLPKYLHDVLHFNLAANGFLSSLPYIVQYFTTLLGGQVADWFIVKRVFSVTVVRKLATCTGMSIAAISLLVASYTGCDHVTTMAFLVVGTGCSAFAQAGHSTNYLDIAPVFSGTLMGIGNTFGTISGFLTPQVVGWLTNEEASSKQWQKVFFITVGLYCFGILSYLILASGKEQEWANQKPNEENEHTQQTSPQTHDGTPDLH